MPQLQVWIRHLIKLLLKQLTDILDIRVGTDVKCNCHLHAMLKMAPRILCAHYAPDLAPKSGSQNCVLVSNLFRVHRSVFSEPCSGPPGGCKRLAGFHLPITVRCDPSQVVLWLP